MNRQRQADVLPEEKLRGLEVTLIGAGAVGSLTALALSKMGVGLLEVYDDDVVAEHNLPNQWFDLAQVGEFKLTALSAQLERLAGFGVEGVHYLPKAARYGGQPLREVTIGAVDSMAGRHYLWRAVQRWKPPLYLDSRMGAELTQLFTIVSGKSSGYAERRMFPASAAEPGRCTAKATIYGAMGTATLICAAVRRYLTGQPPIGALTADWVSGSMLEEEA